MRTQSPHRRPVSRGRLGRAVAALLLTFSLLAAPTVFARPAVDVDGPSELARLVERVFDWITATWDEGSPMIDPVGQPGENGAAGEGGVEPLSGPGDPSSEDPQPEIRVES